MNIGVAIIAVVLLWILVAVGLALLVGRMIGRADEQRRLQQSQRRAQRTTRGSDPRGEPWDDADPEDEHLDEAGQTRRERRRHRHGGGNGGTGPGRAA